MLSIDHWLNVFKAAPGWNDTDGQIVVETREGATWVVSGVHKLDDEEKPAYPTLYFDVRCKDDNREGMKPVLWSWEGMQPHENPGPVFVDKPPHEAASIGIMPGMVISIWIEGGEELARGFRPDDSYFVVFQEVDTSDPPDPPTGEVVGEIQFVIDKVYFDELPVVDGKVTLVVPIMRPEP